MDKELLSWMEWEPTGVAGWGQVLESHKCHIKESGFDAGFGESYLRVLKRGVEGFQEDGVSLLEVGNTEGGAEASGFGFG